MFTSDYLSTIAQKRPRLTNGRFIAHQDRPANRRKYFLEYKHHRRQEGKCAGCQSISLSYWYCFSCRLRRAEKKKRERAEFLNRLHGRIEP